MAGVLTIAPPGSMVIDLGKRKKGDLKPDSGLDWIGYNQAPHDGPDKDARGRWKSGHPSIRALGDMPDFAHHLHDDDLKQAKLQAKSLIQAIEAEEKRRAPAKPLRAAKVKAPVKPIPAALAERVEAMKKRPIPSDLAYLEEELPKLTVAQLEKISQYGDFEGMKLGGDKKAKTQELIRRLAGKLQSEAVTHRAEHKVELDAEFRRRAALADVTGNREEYAALVRGFGVAGTGPGLPPERTVESPESRRINELTALIGKTKPGAEKKALQAERRALGEKIMTGKPVPPKQDFGVGSDPWATRPDDWDDDLDGPYKPDPPGVGGFPQGSEAEAGEIARIGDLGRVDNFDEAALSLGDLAVLNMRRLAIPQLHERAKDDGIEGYENMGRDELVTALIGKPLRLGVDIPISTKNSAKPLRARKVTPVTEGNDISALKTDWSNGTFAMDIDAIIANPQANSPALLTEMLKRLKVAELSELADKHKVKLMGRTKPEKIDSFVASTVQNELNSQAIRSSVGGALAEALEPNHGTAMTSPAQLKKLEDRVANLSALLDKQKRKRVSEGSRVRSKAEAATMNKLTVAKRELREAQVLADAQEGADAVRNLDRPSDSPLQRQLRERQAAADLTRRIGELDTKIRGERSESALAGLRDKKARLEQERAGLTGEAVKPSPVTVTPASPSRQATHLNTPARTVGNGMFFGNQYHGDGNMGQAIRGMSDEQRAINVNGERLDDALADVIIMGHSGEAGVSARQVEAWKKIAAQVEGVDADAAGKIHQALARISAPSGTQGQSMLEGMGAPVPLQKLMGIVEGAAANRFEPDAEAKRLLDIAENYLSGKESAMGMINRVRSLTSRHESQEGFFEVRNAARQAAEELDAMFKAKTLPMRNRQG